MPLLYETNTIKIILDIITKTRAQNNVYGFPRKIITIAQKPFLTLVIYLVQNNPARLRINQTNARQYLYQVSINYPRLGLDSLRNVAFINSYISKKEKLQILENFAFYKDATYVEKPSILVFIATYVEAGLDLPLANAILIVDGTFEAYKEM